MIEDYFKLGQWEAATDTTYLKLGFEAEFIAPGNLQWVQQQMGSVLKIWADIHTLFDETDPTLWSICADSTINEDKGTGAEIVSPAMSLIHEPTWVMNILKFIRENGHTDPSCGFHHRVSYKDVSFMPLALVLAVDEDKLFGWFPDHTRKYARSQTLHLEEQVRANRFYHEGDSLERFLEHGADDLIWSKMASINILDAEKGIAEFRHAGGTGYAHRDSEIGSSMIDHMQAAREAIDSEKNRRLLEARAHDFLRRVLENPAPRFYRVPKRPSPDRLEVFV